MFAGGGKPGEGGMGAESSKGAQAGGGAPSRNRGGRDALHVLAGRRLQSGEEVWP